jgi:4-hydroxy-tetrahydrodipicolinate synthase
MAASRFGLGVALATPVDEAGHIDTGRLAEHATWCVAQGCDVLTLFGTTGEGASFGLAERRRAFAALAAAGLPAARMVCGVAAASVEDAAAQAALAIEAGCRGLLVAPPFYFHGAPEDGVEAWLGTLLGGLPGPAEVLLYHIPSMTGVGLSPALIGRLRAAFPALVAGVKDSSCDWNNTAALLAAHRDLMVLVGDERDLARAVREGGAGTICGLANLIPDRLGKVARQGIDEAAIRPLVEAIVRHPVIPAVKSAIAHRKRDAAWARMRAPLQALPAADAQALGAAMDTILLPVPA